jgi:uncharacterized membrane protein YhfC
MDPFVVLSFLLVVLVEVFFPLALGYLFVKRFGLSWKVFALGFLIFVLVQLIHAPLVLLVQQPLEDYAGRLFPDHVAAVAVYAVILGLLAGLFEELGRFIVYGRFFIGNKIKLSPENAMLFGAGWGGVESILVGVLMLLTLFSYLYAAPLTDEKISQLNVSMNGSLTSEKADAVNQANDALIALTPYDVLPGMAERLFAVTLHITWSVMVLYAVLEKRNGLLVLAVLWHALADASAVFLSRIYGVLAAEGMLFFLALLGILYLRRRWAAFKHII